MSFPQIWSSKFTTIAQVTSNVVIYVTIILLEPLGMCLSNIFMIEIWVQTELKNLTIWKIELKILKF